MQAAVDYYGVMRPDDVVTPTAAHVHRPGEIPFAQDDGGRAAAGFPSLVLQARGPGDCQCRACAIVTGRPYAEVHEALGRLAGDPRAVDEGLPLGFAARYLQPLGWTWTLNMPARIRGHLRPRRLGDLPRGRYAVEFRTRTSGHIAAFLDGVLHDLDDGPTTLPLWGWWSAPCAD